MSGVKWIKLSTGIFDNRKIRQIEKMPDGDALIVIWLKLLILAGDVNDGGMVYFTKDLPYTDQLLATQFDRPLSTVQLALRTFVAFGMIEIVDDLICVSNWAKYQNIEGMEKIREQTRQRVAKHREMKRLSECNVTVTLPVTQSNGTDIDKKEEKEKTKKKDVFVPPTLEEVTAYCRERGNIVDPVKFYDFYTADPDRAWIDSNGKPVRNWKQKVITWERKDEKKPNKVTTAATYTPPKPTSLDELRKKVAGIAQK